MLKSTLKILAISVFFVLTIQCQKAAEKEADPDALEVLLADIEAFEKTNSPLDSLYFGCHKKGHISSVSIEGIQHENDTLTKYIERANALPEQNLTQQINKAVLLYKLNNAKSNLDFKTYLIPLSAEGGFFNELNFILPNLPFNTLDDYQSYLNWLPEFASYLEENKKLLRAGMSESWVAPEVVAENTLKLLEVWRKNPESISPLERPFENFPESISEEDQKRLKAEIKLVMDKTIFPAYEELHQFIANEYLPACKGVVGVSTLKSGKAYYENRVEHFTTLSISPDSVFNLGLAEVARINALMANVVKESGFNGNLEDYIAFLRTDEQFYAKTPDELLHYAAWLSKKAEGKLPQYFEHLYSNPFTVSPVAAAIAPQYTAGRYSSGSLAQHKAGEYWVNTYNLPARPLYALPALTLHEAVPGHHLHHAITEELDSLPGFRQQFYISAFGEGWALYCEYLGEEMGMYNTPAEWFGRYTYEMWRACRLVVDVGLHYKGWTRQEAVDFLAKNTALSMHEVNTEIDRYIGWPGQALSYKMGELKIKELRTRAEKQLGDDFDIGAFHNMLLSQGSVPLSVLDNFMDQWISEQEESN